MLEYVNAHGALEIKVKGGISIGSYQSLTSEESRSTEILSELSGMKRMRFNYSYEMKLQVVRLFDLFEGKNKAVKVINQVPGLERLTFKMIHEWKKNIKNGKYGMWRKIRRIKEAVKRRSNI